MDFLYKAEKEELGRRCAGYWGSWLLVSNLRRSGKRMAWRSSGVSSTHIPCDMMENNYFSLLCRPSRNTGGSTNYQGLNCKL
jgi:hypothetical protein